MRTRSPLILLIGILAVFLPAVILACGGEEPADSTPAVESPQTETAEASDGESEEGRGAASREAARTGSGSTEGQVEHILRMLPQDTEGFVYVDAKGLFGDSPYIQSALRSWWGEAWLFDGYGAHFIGVDGFAYAKLRGSLFVLEGVKDFEAFKDDLYDLHYEEEDGWGTKVLAERVSRTGNRLRLFPTVSCL